MAESQVGAGGTEQAEVGAGRRIPLSVHGGMSLLSSR